MPKIHIPPDLLARCFEVGRTAYPEEGVAALSGPADDPGALTGFHPLENVINRLHDEDPERYPRTGRDGYVLDPRAYLKLEKSLAAAGEALRVLVHTHVDVGAYFSDEDKRRATWAGEPLLPGIAYLVCGVKERRPDGAIVAYFDVGTRQFETVTLVAP